MLRMATLTSLVLGTFLLTSCSRESKPEPDAGPLPSAEHPAKTEKAVLAATPKPARRSPDQSAGACIGVPSITRHEIYMVVKAESFKVRKCYRRALQRKPKLSGKIRAWFKMTDKGLETKIVDSEVDDKQFEKCVQRALETFRFPPRRYTIQGVVIVKYPFVFLPENPDGKPKQVKIRYSEGESLAIDKSKEIVTIILPSKAQEALTRAFPDYRLLTSGDFIKGDTEINLPNPFFAVADFDKSPGDDLAIALVHKQKPRQWRLVVIHHHPDSYRPILVTDFSSISSHFPETSSRRQSFFVTADARCFCEHQCLAIASDTGRSFEFEWNGEAYAGHLEKYLAPRDSE
jgi:hypothetical protein